MWTKRDALPRAKGVHRPELTDTWALTTLANALTIDIEALFHSRSRETFLGHYDRPRRYPIPQPNPFQSPKRRFSNQIDVSALGSCCMQEPV